MAGGSRRHTSADFYGQGKALALSLRLLERAFADGLVADPYLRILLDLYLAGLEGRSLCQSGLAQTPALSSAHRQVARLADLGLVERRPDPHDHRCTLVTLSATARDRLDRVMGQTLSINGPAPLH